MAASPAPRDTRRSISGRPLHGGSDDLIITLPARISPLGTERRKADRHLVHAPADLVLGGDGIDITILDMSETGFRAYVEGELKIGSWVQLSLKGVSAPEAQLRWNRGPEYGFRFAFPLAPEFVAAAFSEAVVRGVAAEPIAGANDQAPVEAADAVMTWEDYLGRRVRCGGSLIPLTPLMTEALSVLLIRRGEEISGADLARAVWPDDVATPGRMATLHVIISRIRGRVPDLIRSPNRGSYVVPLPPKA